MFDRVFIVPDGAINLVSFATLPDDGGRYLLKSGPQFHYSSAERDLVAAERAGPSGAGALVVGAPDFDRAGVEVAIRRRKHPCGIVPQSAGVLLRIAVDAFQAPPRHAGRGGRASSGCGTTAWPTAMARPPAQCD